MVEQEKKLLFSHFLKRKIIFSEKEVKVWGYKWSQTALPVVFVSSNLFVDLFVWCLPGPTCRTSSLLLSQFICILQALLLNEFPLKSREELWALFLLLSHSFHYLFGFIYIKQLAVLRLGEFLSSLFSFNWIFNRN